MSSSKPAAVGIDFGTTNSSLALVREGVVSVANFPFFGAATETYRSVLFFENRERGKPAPKPLAGPRAIERYLEPHDGGRLIQSLKSFAGSRSFTTTGIDGRSYTLEELIGTFLRRLRAEGGV